MSNATPSLDYMAILVNTNFSKSRDVWVIERGDSPVDIPLYFTGQRRPGLVHWWSGKIEEAIAFISEEDARRTSAVFYPGKCRYSEWMWDSLTRTATRIKVR